VPVEGDLERLPASLFPREPYVVVHVASKQIDRDGSGFDAVNVGGTRALLGALTPACRGVIYGSSISVYGQGAQEGNDEDAPLSPDTPLARSRVDAERAIFDAARSRGFDAFALRPRFILGRGDRFTLPGLVRLFARGISLGSGAQAFTIVDVADYAEVVLRLADRIARGETARGQCAALHVGYRRAVTLDEIHRTLSCAFPLPRVRVRVPVTPRITRTLARVPSASVRAATTKLELMGLSHRVSVGRLAGQIGGDLVDRDPLLTLQSAAHALHREASA
jgi:nucleoside-diphosphate-sugar epimerase